MKKTFLIVMLCCIASVSAFAQTTTKVVKGAVIDKDGNPLPGAVVEATGGAESAVVDADGTFSIEVPIWLKSLTAKYAGMKDKKKKISGSDMIFEMKQNSAKWFASLIGSYACFGDEIEDNYLSMGIMAGYIDNWGGYAKITLPVSQIVIRKKPNVSLGVIKSLSSASNIYLGIGYASIPEWDYYDDEYWYGPDDAFMIEFGTIFNLSKRINLNAGIVYCSEWDYNFECSRFELQLGLGFRF